MARARAGREGGAGGGLGKQPAVQLGKSEFWRVLGLVSFFLTLFC